METTARHSVQGSLLDLVTDTHRADDGQLSILDAEPDHYTVTTYLGTTHYDSRGRVFTTRELAEGHKRRCEGGSGRSGGGSAATINPCDCAEWAGRE